jgi:threonylcarbamoyladenosine tRNA methylthiotransferase MtaB
LFNKSFHIITLGCKINIYESESIAYSLQSKGYKLQDNAEYSDIVIINTCTVTFRADSKCRRIITKARKQNPQALVIVCGCLVNTNLNELLKEISADIFV